jgi:hypothetical protein
VTRRTFEEGSGLTRLGGAEELVGGTRDIFREFGTRGFLGVRSYLLLDLVRGRFASEAEGRE